MDFIEDDVTENVEELPDDSEAITFEEDESKEDVLVETKETETEKVDKSSRITVVIYRGDADAFNYGPYTFRPGSPAALPSDLAEELLTYPHELFEVKE